MRLGFKSRRLLAKVVLANSVLTLILAPTAIAVEFIWAFHWLLLPLALSGLSGLTLSVILLRQREMDNAIQNQHN